MARYFKVIEIDRDSFIEAVGEDLDCAQLVTACDGIGYAAVDDTEEDELNIPLYCYEEEPPMSGNRCVCCGESIPEGIMVCSICSKFNENLVTPEFICEQLAERFDEPCNMSLFEEELHDTEEKTNGATSFAAKQRRRLLDALLPTQIQRKGGKYEWVTKLHYARPTGRVFPVEKTAYIC